MIITFVILALIIFLFIFGRVRTDVVGLLAILALYLAGIIDLSQTLAGFSDPTVIMIAGLFVVGEGLSRTGVTAWLGERMLGFAGSNKLRLLIVLLVGTAVLSAFISNTGTVATLMPAVTSAAWGIGSIPSKFLMPLAFAANTGGLLTLTGTPPNIIVNNTLVEAGFEPFNYFEFSRIGLPLLAMVIIYMATIGRRLLPARKSEERPVELSELMGEFAQDYTLEGNLYWLRIRFGSALVGKTLADAGLGRDYNVTVLRIDQAAGGDEKSAGETEKARLDVLQQIEKLQPEPEHDRPGPDTVIEARDKLLVKGDRQAIERLMVRFNLGVQTIDEGAEPMAAMLLSHEVGMAEVLLTPRSAYIGQTLKEGQFADKYNVRVLGIRRQDKQLERKDIPLEFGDALLVRGRWKDIEVMQREARNFVVVGSPESMARQVVELSPRAVLATLALGAMVVLMVSGLVPTVIAVLVAALIMILGGCLSMGQAYRSINWQSVVLIAAMIPLSTALQVTGGAELLANGLVQSLGGIGPMALLAGVFLVTAGLSQVISNSATTVLVAPIILKAGIELGLNPYPLLMTVAIGASAVFLTPIGTSTNLMVSAPGGYGFKDFMRVGLPLTIIFFLISLLLVPLIWPF